MRKSNYDKQPSTHIEGKIVCGWDNIIKVLSEAWADEPVWAIDLYPGTYEEDFLEAFAKTGRKIINTRDLMRPEAEIRQLTERFMTDDVLFGYMSNVRLEEYFKPTTDNRQATLDGRRESQRTTDNVIYNLAGQRIQKMQKGINIINGKKVMVK